MGCIRFASSLTSALVAITALIVLGGATANPAEAKRVALVIGIAKYDQLTKLNNPGNDAKAVAALLEAHGIAPTIKLDLTHAELLSALSDFEAEAQDAELALVYYAGHGLNLAGRDVLLPKDAAQKCGDLAPSEAQKGTVAVDKVIDALRSARQRIVILDACRSATFPSCPPKRGAEVAGFRGLGRIEAQGTLIATSTAPGGLADDGPPGANSPFATRLLRHLKERPNAYFHDVLIAVNHDMASAPGGATGDLYFAGGVPPRACLAKDGCGVAAGGTAASGAASPPPPSSSDAELTRLKAEIEELRRKQAEQQQAREPGKPEATSQGWWPWNRAPEKAEPARPQEQANLAPQPKPASGANSTTLIPRKDSPEQSFRRYDSTMKRGAVFRDCPECPEMVVVPAGSFMMGAAKDRALSDDERPQHRVTIASPFAAGKFETTFAEWDECVSAGGCQHKPDDEGWGRAKRPVINVSWDDATQFTAWLSMISGKSYRLLTEAEWEYAARAGTKSNYSWGDDISSDVVNFKGYGTAKEGTIEVGSFKPNPFGLHDVHGNVWEWVEDCWHASYNGAPSDGSAWKAACSDSARRAIRGGSQIYLPWDNRASLRDNRKAITQENHLGFRVARSLD